MPEHMDFTPIATQFVTRHHGIDSVDELRNLDGDKAFYLCWVLCHSGRTNDIGAVNPGTKVSARAKDYLMLAIYFVKHQLLEVFLADLWTI